MPATWDPERKVTNDHILPYVDSHDPATPEPVRRALHTLPFERNVFKLLGNSPTTCSPFMSLLGAFFSQTKALRPSDWQLTVLLTSRWLDAPYEWDVNAPVARLLPNFQPWEKYSELIAAKDLSDTSLFTDRQRLIGQFSAEVHSSANMVSEKTMVALKNGGFDDAQIVELFMTAGGYGSLARFMKSAKIDFDEPIPGLDEMLRKTFAFDIEREQQLMAEEKT